MTRRQKASAVAARRHELAWIIPLLANGEQLLAWFDSDLFHDIVAGAIVLAVALTVLSMLRFVGATRSPHRRRASA